MARKTPFSHAFKVGLFVLTALVLMCAAGLRVGVQRYFRNSNEYFTYLHTVPCDLQKDSIVYLEGYKIGNVSSIIQFYKPVIYTKVTMKIDCDVPIDPVNMNVQMLRPLIGGPVSLQMCVREIAREGDPEQPPCTEDFDFVTGNESNYITALVFDRLGLIEEKISATLEKISVTLEKLSPLDIVTLQSKFLETAQGVSQTLYSINARITDERFDSGMTSFESILAHGAALVSNVERQVDHQALANTITYANTIASNLSMLSSRMEQALPEPRLRAMAANVDRTFTSTPGMIEDFRDLSSELQRTLAALTRLLEAAERNPSMFMFGKQTPKTEEPGESQ